MHVIMLIKKHLFNSYCQVLQHCLKCSVLAHIRETQRKAQGYSTAGIMEIQEMTQQKAGLKYN